MSAFSKNKPEVQVRALSFTRSLEDAGTVASAPARVPRRLQGPGGGLKANPWFAEALPVVEGAKSPPSARSTPTGFDVIRSNMNAYLAGTNDRRGIQRHEDEARADIALGWAFRLGIQSG